MSEPDPLPACQPADSNVNHVPDAQGSVRYDALLNLIEEIQKRRFIKEVVLVVAAQWKSCVNLDNWRMLCVYEKQCVLISVAGQNTQVLELGLDQLARYDEKIWRESIPSELRGAALEAIRDVLPEELSPAPGQTLLTLPVQHGYTTTAVLSVLSSTSGFDEMDRKFIALVASVTATRIVGMLAEQILSRERNELIVKLGQLAVTDSLTGVANRRGADAALSYEIVRSRRYSEPLSLVLFDIDHFKKVNDAHGNAVGDKVLSAVAATVQKLLRNTDKIARWGGEEFLVILPHTDMDQAFQTAERVRAAIRDHQDLPCQITVSLGVAGLSETDTLQQIVDRADRGLYQAKKSGRNQTCVMQYSLEES
jgi:diguanylate cyclase (GGDEF)-like protein